MDKAEFREKLEELIDTNTVRMKEKIDGILNSGAIDIEAEPEDTYGLVKDCLVALLEDGCWQWSSAWCSNDIQRKSKRNIRNIRNCI